MHIITGKNRKINTICSIAITAVFIFSILATIDTSVYGKAYPDITTSGFISAAPNTIGVGQQLVVNFWIQPAPQYPSGYAQNIAISNLGYANVTVTFTKPDGTTDTFKPSNPSLAAIGVAPGWTESLGTSYFNYKPDRVGTWSVTFSFPGQTFSEQNGTQIDTLYYKPCTAPAYKFVVQSEPVNAGIINGYPYSPLPNNYWSSPVNVDNREWSQISGDWLQSGYDGLVGKYNPYSTGPNTAHIVWRKEQVLGGLMGGDWGSYSYFAGQVAIIMAGKVYYNKPAGGAFVCIDLRTGSQLYEANGTINIGWHWMPAYQVAAQQNQGIPVAYLINTATWAYYDPETGALIQTLTNVPANTQTVWFNDGSPIVYLTQRQGWNTTIPMKYAWESVIKWDYSKVTNRDWRTGLVWNSSIRQPDGLGVGDGRQSVCLGYYEAANVIVVKATNDGQTFMGFDATTGARIWTTNTDYFDLSFVTGYGWGSSSGPLLQFDGVTSMLIGYDIKTGKEIWRSPIGEYPWGDIPAYYGVTIGDVRFSPRYDGYIYAINMTNGKQIWRSDNVGVTGETVQNTWTFGGSSYANNGNPYAAADGKVYISSQTNYRGQPKTRGCQLYAINATTGKFVWTVSGAIAPTAISQGYLLGINDNDGYLYCFGKGKTETTVQGPMTAVQAGSDLLIQGSVTDQSPAQKGTPAVSDSSMTEWMNYLNMQNATLINSPPTPKGVQVHLTAIDPNGNCQDLGFATTTGGSYGLAYRPPIPGMYTVTATFAGSESYWSSSAVTHLLVSAPPAPSASIAPSATPKPTTSETAVPTSTPTASSPSPAVPPGTNPLPMSTLAIVAAAIIAIIVVVAAIIVRKRKT
jgi:outer membrane protein assembly factor BamB